MKYLHFFLFLWVIFSLLDPDPAEKIYTDPFGSATLTGSTRNVYRYLYRTVPCGFLLDKTTFLSQHEGFGADPDWAIKSQLIESHDTDLRIRSYGD